ncbi:DUF1648 domain-containing protein [Lysinibacillus sphaericus]|uniref:Predicted integral membrane protein n=1 Tax=Lysinibacillus sphaericus TaxID=1421 RepID=A0A2S0JVI7_LYSSH|nr:DUF1648 domain-containing protein [Lysinibacillus sphaericus]AVK95150.1 hypothetical protein LS41612_01990 [Lysinibacillus sphaericus]MED4544775.1 DUF1648 domain-containing protein [Lysinibacillus sphaericus]TKI18216.1 DUF1648 domain-containing protein [Lysinibacillus sphaericus]SUV19462.1 Predicted integral membrane protein [Lysinibacillus sphaericus]GEC83390.1 hypothetical protein LSP03_31330 [Lysinibacillus sphaericus]
MYRPILTLPKTKYEKCLDVIGSGLFTVSILFIILQWGNLPGEIPAHFNAKGEVDRWGSKIEVLILPGIGIFMWIFLGLLEKAPHMHNYPARLNERNVEAFYLNSRRLCNEVKNFCLILFAIISCEIVLVALGKIEGLGWWFLPVVLIGTGIPILKGLIASSKIK